MEQAIDAAKCCNMALLLEMINHDTRKALLFLKTFDLCQLSETVSAAGKTPASLFFAHILISLD